MLDLIADRSPINFFFHKLIVIFQLYVHGESAEWHFTQNFLQRIL
jgi:hypothetical protein